MQNMLCSPVEIIKSRSPWKQYDVLVDEIQLLNGVYHCPKCQMVSHFKANVKQHLKDKHLSRAKPYKCQFCLYETNRKYNLKVHYQSCTVRKQAMVAQGEFSDGT